MSDGETWQRFERVAMPHVDAAYNLARWLTRDDHDAQDVVQEALMRAMRYIGTFRGEGGRAWLLQIVRNTCYSWLSENRRADHAALDESEEAWQAVPAPAADEPPAIALRKAEKEQIDAAIAGLPVPFREVLVLRELEDLSYADIARIAEIPIGTVMSRLSRARAMVRESLSALARPQLRPVPRVTQGGGTS